jgi:hypothetical protein
VLSDFEGIVVFCWLTIVTDPPPIADEVFLLGLAFDWLLLFEDPVLDYEFVWFWVFTG